MTTQTDRVTGISASVAYKAPCIAAATTNITLLGEQTINGIAVVAGDRVLVTGQDAARENGIYVVATGLWARASDMNETGDIVEGTSVRVTRGTNYGLWVVTTTGDIVVDTTSIAFAVDTSLVAAGYMRTDNNLSDVGDVPTALANIGAQASAASLDAWADVVRAVGFDDFAAEASGGNLLALLADVTGTGNVVFSDTPSLTDPSIVGSITEDVFAITDAAGFQIDPANGSVQTITLGADRTPAATAFESGQSVTLMIEDGSSYSITWTTVAVSWVGGVAPALASSGYTVVELWKVGVTIYGAYVGDVP